MTTLNHLLMIYSIRNPRISSSLHVPPCSFGHEAILAPELSAIKYNFQPPGVNLENLNETLRRNLSAAHTQGTIRRSQEVAADKVRHYLNSLQAKEVV